MDSKHPRRFSKILKQNEFEGLTFTYNGAKIDALKNYGFKEGIWASVGAMIAIGFGLKLLGYLGFYIISTPKPVYINPDHEEKIEIE